MRNARRLGATGNEPAGSALWRVPVLLGQTPLPEVDARTWRIESALRLIYKFCALPKQQAERRNHLGYLRPKVWCAWMAAGRRPFYGRKAMGRTLKRCFVRRFYDYQQLLINSFSVPLITHGGLLGCSIRREPAHLSEVLSPDSRYLRAKILRSRLGPYRRQLADASGSERIRSSCRPGVTG